MKITLILRILLLLGVAVLFLVPIPHASLVHADDVCTSSCLSVDPGLDCSDFNSCINSCDLGREKCMFCCSPLQQ